MALGPETKEGAALPQSKQANSVVVVKTTLGEFEIELYGDKTPATVNNFLRYVDEGFYNGTCFHRVINDFMVQGGGFTPDMKQKSTHEPIANEAEKGVANERGVIAMARTMDPNSATSQFFINVVNNEFLNFQSATPRGFGYCGFGKITAGLDVLDKIKVVKTSSNSGHQDVPVTPVVIESITRK
jgi:peptidyl-prolyl cis-trans isomerase B (cyclophilin B)